MLLTRVTWECLKWAIASLLVPLIVGLATSARGDEPSARERLEAMSAEEKEELAARRERFDKFSPEEQARLRELDQQLAADPQAEQLRGVMNRYYEWLKTLDSDQRAQLLSKSGEERIRMIRELTDEQEKQRFRRLADQRLSPEDLEHVYDWTTTYIRSRESELVNSLPENQQQEVTEIEEESRRWRHLFWLLRSRELPPPALPSEEETNALIGKLSSEAKEIFAAATSDQDRTELVQRWIRASMFSRMVQSVSEEELLAFMQNELDPRLRARLEALPREEMQHELRRSYFFHKFRGFGGGPARFGPPGKPPFDRNNDHGPEGRPENRGPDSERRRDGAPERGNRKPPPPPE